MHSRVDTFMHFAIAGEHRVHHDTANKTLFQFAFDHISMLPLSYTKLMGTTTFHSRVTCFNYE